jgi:hypothetical protein
MKISGFTIIKNAVQNEYPIVEAIRSILPVVDEMIVLTGDSTDSTNELIEAIKDPKIKRIDSVWDPSLRKDGKVLAVETDKAFRLIDPNSDWAFYIQADEVIHQKYHHAILEGCKKYKDNKSVDGLLFKYLHFYGTYDYVGDSRTWYSHEVRIIRNDKSINAFRDAQGFRRGRKKLHVKEIDAYVYHYGWVKSPAQMKIKIDNFNRLWHDDEEMKRYIIPSDVFDYNEYDSLARFNGTHPQVMQERVNRLNWKLNLDTKIKRFDFKDRLLYYFEKLTGIRLFDFRNYKKI